MASVLNHNAQVMSDAQLKEQIADEPPDTQQEILRINEQARPRSLQAALLIPCSLPSWASACRSG